MNGRKLLKPVCHHGQAFSNLEFFSALFWVNRGVFSPEDLLRALVTFFHVFYLFGFSVMFSSFPYFPPKLFCFLVIWLLVCLHALSSGLLVEFSFFVLEYLVCIPVFLLTLVPSDLSRDVFFHCCVDFLFQSQHISAFFLYLRIFACCRRFLICVSSLISHSGFDFLFVLFRGTPTLSRNYFDPA